jgi:transposase
MAKNKGRDRRREARWRRIIREHGRSGLGVREFCRRGKLTETAFYFWRRELQRRQEQQDQRAAIEPPPKPTFVAVRVNEPAASPAVGRIEIELSSGRRVHVIAPVDRQALVDVLAVLEGRPC